METKTFLENIKERNEDIQSIHFLLRQMTSKKGSKIKLDDVREQFTRYLTNGLTDEGVPLLTFSKGRYNNMLKKVFEQYNRDNASTKSIIQTHIDTMVDEYVAKHIGPEQNTILTLKTLTDAITTRRSGLHHHLFDLFFARMLTDQIRQIIWRAALVFFCTFNKRLMKMKNKLLN